MEERALEFRTAVLAHIRLVASAEAQLKYEIDVPIAQVPAELICGFVDELYQPKSELMLTGFTNDELKGLAELYGRLCAASEAFSREDASTVQEILKIPEWRSVMSFAKQLAADLGGDA